MAVRPYLVNGDWRTGEGTFEVHSPYDDSMVAEIGVPTEADVEEAVATAAATFEESKRLPIHARSEALDHISKRLSETIPENAELIAREGGKPLKWATVEATRAVSTFRWASEVLRHGDDEMMRLDTEAALGSRVGLMRRFPLRAGPRHHAVQLPPEPRRPQGRALPRGRRADRRQAGERDPDRVAAPRGVLRRDRPAQGHVPGAAGELEGRRRDGAGRPVPQDLVHRLLRDRLVPEGPGPEEARDPGARWERGRDRALGCRPGSRGTADRVRRVLPGRPVVHASPALAASGRIPVRPTPCRRPCRRQSRQGRERRPGVSDRPNGSKMIIGGRLHTGGGRLAHECRDLRQDHRRAHDDLRPVGER